MYIIEWKYFNFQSNISPNFDFKNKDKYILVNIINICNQHAVIADITLFHITPIQVKAITQMINQQNKSYNLSKTTTKLHNLILPCKPIQRNISEHYESFPNQFSCFV